MSTALLIIDVQQALCTGEYAAHDITAVVERINGLSQRARAAGLPVVLVQHEEAQGPMQAGSAGWALAPDLQISPTDLSVRKRTPNSFHETGLDALLKARGVDRLVICGLQTEFCVDTTVRQALPLGYAVVLAADGHSTCDDVLTAPQAIAHHNRTLGFFGGFGTAVQVVAAAQINLLA
jgi:nicotinamidase-related amidase